MYDPHLNLEAQHMNEIHVYKPRVQSFKGFVAGLLFRAADSWISCRRQSHGTQHKRGDGLNRQYIYLSPLHILLWHKQTRLIYHSQYPKPGRVFWQKLSYLPLAEFPPLGQSWLAEWPALPTEWPTSPQTVSDCSSLQDHMNGSNCLIIMYCKKEYICLPDVNTVTDCMKLVLSGCVYSYFSAKLLIG